MSNKQSDELNVKLENILDILQISEGSRADYDKAITSIKAELKKLIERVENEVIQPDQQMPQLQVTMENADEVFEKHYGNKLRAEQRKTLDKISKEIE